MTVSGALDRAETNPGSQDLAQRLERGELVHYPSCPFSLPSEDARAFLATQELVGSAHKNISYDPGRHRLHGITPRSAEEGERLREVFRAFSQSVSGWLAQQLPGYASAWQLDRVSYRPLEEATRNLRLHARNDLLHIDAFPTRPTNGCRILRVFVNVNVSEPRVWVTSDTFGRLLELFGEGAGLPARGFSLSKAMGLLRDMPRLFQPDRRPRSEYDQFMVRFHNFLKSHEPFQDRSVKRLWTFAPGSAWVAMTDSLSHAVLRGRHALEHSFFISPKTLVLPEESPAALLAKKCGFPVLPHAA